MAIVREKRKIRVQSMNGGEDSTSEPSTVKQPYASIARGININKLGRYPQRLGPVRIGDTPDSLVSSWDFHDSTADDSIGSNDGAETSIQYEDGKFGKSAVFNGTTSDIDVTADASLSVFSVGGPICLTTWIYPLSDGGSDEGRIIDNIGDTSAGYRFWVSGEAGNAVKLNFEVGYSTTNAKVTTSTTLPLGAWAKVEAHLNSDDSCDILINGVVASYSTDTTGVGSVSDDSSNDVHIGSKTAGENTFDGQLERVRFYNTARTSDEYSMKKTVGLTRYKVGATIDRLYRMRGTNFERLDDDLDEFTVIDSGFTDGTRTNFVTAKDILFILNGVENVHTSDTSETITDEGSGTTDPPKSTLGAWAQNNRLFLSGSLTESLRDMVWFSDTDDPQTFDTTAVTGNFFRVTSRNGGKVTWMEPFKLNELIIYKEDSIYVLNMTGATPLSDWELQPVNATIGCRAGRTVKDIGNDQVFLDDQGFVRLLSRTSFDKLKTSIISGPVQDILDTMNIDEIEKATSELINGKYYLSIPTDTNSENNVTLVWDTEAAALTGNPASGWTVIPDGIWYPSDFAIFEFGDNEITLVHADNRAISQLYKHSANTDDGKTITAEIAGPTHDMGNRGTTKIWGPLHVVWDSGENTEVEMFIEFDDEGFQSIGTFSLLGNAPILPIDLPFQLSGSEKRTELLEARHLGNGKTCRVKAVHSNHNSTATFVEYELFAEERIPRKQNGVS